jgi:hypothetical protein
MDSIALGAANGAVVGVLLALSLIPVILWLRRAEAPRRRAPESRDAGVP